MEKVTDDEPAVQRFELTGPKRMEAGTTIQLVADCKAKQAASRLLLSAIPPHYAVYPRSIPLNPGINLVRVRVLVDGPPGRATIVGRLGEIIREDAVIVEASRRPAR